jgi:hypothetical protein
MKQTYFQEPRYSKNYLILNPQNLYEQYVNAFAFSEMVKSQNLVQNKKELQLQAQNSWREVRTNDKNIVLNLISELLKTPVRPPPFTFFLQQNIEIRPSVSPPDVLPEPSANIQVSRNATAQNQSNAILQKANVNLCEYTNLSRVATSLELHAQFSSKIKDLKKTIMLEKKKFQRLKGNAAAQQRARKKKKERLEKENIVKIYDTPGRPSFLINESNLLENMHNSIEFGAADHKRRKEVIKV